MKYLLLIIALVILIMVLRAVINNASWRNLAKQHPAEFLSCLSSSIDWKITFEQGQTYSSVDIPFNGQSKSLWLRYDGKESQIKKKIREKILSGEVVANPFAKYLLSPEDFLYEIAQKNEVITGLNGILPNEGDDFTDKVSEASYIELILLLIKEPWMFIPSTGRYEDSQPLYLQTLNKTVFFTPRSNTLYSIYRRDSVMSGFNMKSIKNPEEAYLVFLLKWSHFCEEHPERNIIDCGTKWVKCQPGKPADHIDYNLGKVEKGNASIKIEKYFPLGAIVTCSRPIHGISNSERLTSYVTYQSIERMLSSNVEKQDPFIIGLGGKWSVHAKIDPSTGHYVFAGDTSSGTMNFKSFQDDDATVLINGKEFTISYSEVKRLLLGETKEPTLKKYTPENSIEKSFSNAPSPGSRYMLKIPIRGVVESHPVTVYSSSDSEVKIIDETNGQEFTYQIDEFISKSTIID